MIEQLTALVNCRGWEKHKRDALAFGLGISPGARRGDATLCDEHAGFTANKIPTIPRLVRRGLRAGLVGHGNLIWTVGDDGWIFEGRPTNVVTSEYHGYPVLEWESIARLVYKRYSQWARTSGSRQDRLASVQCRIRYRF
ncbi:MAG: hypothetical protein OXN89_23275 [Bryobacterales bacterium]|nr:hypothetical protein [Bryobacterales bacterium]